MGELRICANVITGDGVNSTEWARMVQSLAGKVDTLFVSYNGKFDRLPYKSSFDDIEIITEKTEWDDDFAAARNHALAMVPPGEFDWIVWVDTDDTLEEESEGAFRRMFGELDPLTQGIMLRYDYGVQQETGKVIVKQWRERCFRTDANWVWEYMIHEVCHAPVGTQYKRATEAWVKHHRTVESQGQSKTRERNRRILMRARREHPEQPRYTMQLANEIYAEIESKKDDDKFDRKELVDLVITAAQLYSEFIKSAGWDDEAYSANHRIAECYRAISEHDKAIDVDLQGIKIFPHWPSSYLGIARSYMEAGHWENMLHWTDACIQLASPPDTANAIDITEMTFTPSVLRGIALENLGRVDEAIESYLLANEDQPSPKLLTKIRELRKLEGAPTQAERDEIKKLDMKLARAGKGDKTIAFFTSPLFEPWHPELEKLQGAGGAETCIMRLAPMFAADGWRVVVYGTPGEHEGIDADGVEWWNSADYNPAEKVKVLVSSRTPQLLDGAGAADHNILWLHDVNTGPDSAMGPWGNRYEMADAVVTLSRWHRTRTQQLYGVPGEKLHIVPNGIDPTLFDLNPARKDHRYVYSSSPDRGLDVLLSMWPDVKREIPDAELHVYYGWDAIDRILQTRPGHHLARFREGMMQLLQHIEDTCGGVVWHGRIPQRELANEFLRSDMWLYPTYFLETACITAAETQAAGCIPLVNPIGALDENVHPRESLRVNGWPNNDTFRKEYIARLVQFSGAPARHDLRSELRQFAQSYTWRASYDAWNVLLESLDVSRGSRKPVLIGTP